MLFFTSYFFFPSLAVFAKLSGKGGRVLHTYSLWGRSQGVWGPVVGAGEVSFTPSLLSPGLGAAVSREGRGRDAGTAEPGKASCPAGTYLGGGGSPPPAAAAGPSVSGSARPGGPRGPGQAGSAPSAGHVGASPSEGVATLYFLWNSQFYLSYVGINEYVLVLRHPS